MKKLIVKEPRPSDIVLDKILGHFINMEDAVTIARNKKEIMVGNKYQLN